MPRFAVHSGYQINRKTFRTFVSGLPEQKICFISQRNISVFVSWKNRIKTIRAKGKMYADIISRSTLDLDDGKVQRGDAKYFCCFITNVTEIYSPC
jgi:hypothetical protein